MINEELAFKAIKDEIELKEIVGLNSCMRQQKLKGLLNRFNKTKHSTLLQKRSELHNYLSGLVDFMIDEISPTVNKNSFKIYKKAIIPIIPFNDLIEKLKCTSGISKRDMPRSTSSNRQKFLTMSQLNEVVKYNAEFRYRSDLAKVSSLLLQATVLVGLRPGEWFSSMLRTCNGRPTLIIRTEKQYSKRLSYLNIDREDDLSLFLPFRGIPLDHLDEDEREIVRNCHHIMSGLKQEQVQNVAFLKKISESINISITSIWGREKPAINIYSARHQFAANLKASDIDDGLVTYLMGQLFDDTKHRHYASEKKGEIRPAPYNVLEIQAFVQKEINEKVRLKESQGGELQG
jgi:hypothetical protein